MKRRGARALHLIVSGLVVLGAGAACRKNPQVGFELDVPSAVASQATWYEIGTFPGASCAALGPRLTGGLPQGSAERFAFKTTDPPPAIGDIVRESYAFAGVAKTDSCAVIAIGCNDVDVGSANSVALSLQAITNGEGACGAGSVCDAAECVPALDNGNPAVGAGCSLQLVGAGPLGDSLAGGGTLESAPAVSATDSGFLIGYREVDPTTGNARLVIVPVDPGGGVLTPLRTGLPNRCAGDTESDATGLALLPDQGIVAVGRAPCGASGGIDYFTIDRTGDVGTSSFFGDVGIEPILSTAHAIAQRPGAEDYYIAFTVNGQASIASVVPGAQGPQQGPGTAFQAQPSTDAWITTNDKVIALLTVGTDSATPPVDAGADSGSAPAPTPEGGVSTSLRLQLAPASTAVNGLAAVTPVEFQGAWGSLAANGTRVYVASDGASAARPVAYRAFELGNATPVVNDALSTQGLGAPLYTDVAFQGDRVFFAVERPGAISLVAYSGATTTPVFLREVPLGNDPRIPSIANVKDGRIAVAATDSRVIVAWTTAQTLGLSDAAGGYAEFACSD